MKMSRKEQRKLAELESILDGITQFAEAMGGLRKQLLEQGFGEEVVDAIIVTALDQS
jgi:endonuclease III-like uncharacterized protein